jgi:hypothetical protein
MYLVGGMIPMARLPIILTIMLIFMSASVMATWWNTSYPNRALINCSLAYEGQPVAINGSSLYIDGLKQTIWTNCQLSGSVYFYWASNASYAVANDTAAMPFEVEEGTVASFNPTAVWGSEYWMVLHMSRNTTHLLDSTSRNRSMLIYGTPTNATSSFIGKAIKKAGNTQYFTCPNCANGLSNVTMLWIVNTTCTASASYFYIGNEGAWGDSALQTLYADPANKLVGMNTRVSGAFVGDIWASGGCSPNRYNTDVFVASGTSRKVYINKTLRGSDASNANMAFASTDYINMFDGPDGKESNGATVDEMRVYNKELTSLQINQTLYNLYNVAGYGMVGSQENNSGGDSGTPPAVTLIQSQPSEGLNTTTSPLIMCNATVINDTITKFNINLYYRNGVMTFLQNKTFSTNLTSYNTTFTITNAYYNYSWNCNSTSASGLINSTGYRNFTYDATAPTVTIQLPINNTIYNSTVLLTPTLNYMAIDPYRDSCYYTLDSGSAVALASCANGTVPNISAGRHNISVYVNDTFGNIAFNTTNIRIGNITSNMTTATLSNVSLPLNVGITFNLGAAVQGACNVISNSSAISCTGQSLGSSPQSIPCVVNSNYYVSVALYPQCADSDSYKYNGSIVIYNVSTLVNATFSITQNLPANAYKTNANSINLSCNITQVNQTVDYLDINIWQGTTLINKTRFNSSGVENTTGWCFQETANVSTACGGLATGKYFISNYTEKYLYINYSLPATTTSAFWQTKMGERSAPVTTNNSIPNICLSNPVQLRAYIDGGGSNVFGQCYNGTGWITITSTVSGAYNGYSPSPSGTGKTMFDGNWDTWSAAADVWYYMNWTDNDVYTRLRFYEEAMWWYISNPYNLNSTFIATPTLSSDGSYSWDCAAKSITGLNTSAGNRSFTRDTILPSITINDPIELQARSATSSPFSINFNYTVADAGVIDKCWYYLNGGTKVDIGSCLNISIGSITATDNYLNFYANDTYNNVVNLQRNFSIAYMGITNLSALGAINTAFSSQLAVDINSEVINCTIAANVTCAVSIGPICLIPFMTCTNVISAGTGTVNCLPSSDSDDQQVDLWVTCRRSNGQIFNSTHVSKYVDTIKPYPTVATFNGENQSYKSRNITGAFTWTDSNLFRINVTIDGIPIFQQSDINTTTYNYTLNRNVANLTPGRHIFSAQMWDSHTAEVIQDYKVSSPILSNTMTFNTGKNKVSIKAIDEGLQVINPLKAKKEKDRYTFDYIPSKEQESYSFEVKTDLPLTIINKPNSYWRTWIVSGNNWVDFYMPDTLDNTVAIKKMDDYTALVTVSSKSADAKSNGKDKKLVELSGKALKFSSIGDLNMNQQNYTFYTYNATISYLPIVDETQSQSPTLLIARGSSDESEAANFTYNSISQTKIAVSNATYTLFNSTFDTPTIGALSTAIYIGNWSYNINGETGNLLFNQTVIRIGVDNCSNFTNKMLKLTIFDESSPTIQLIGSLEAELTYTSGGSLSKTVNLAMAGNSTYYICSQNLSTNISTDIYLKYTVPAGFTHRYYAQKYNLSGTIQQNISIYNFNTTSGISLLEVTARDYYTNMYWVDAIAKLQRYYVGEGVWRTVQMDKTDTFGLAVFHILEQTTDYRLLFTDLDNMLIKQTESVKFACSGGVCNPTILLTAPSAASASTALNSSYTYDSSTGVINVAWNDPQTGTNTVKVLAQKQTYTGTLTVCNSTQTGSAGSSSCNTSGITGELLFTITGNGKSMTSEYISLNTTKLGTQLQGAEGAFWAVMIMLACIGFGVISPAIAIIAMFIGLVAIYFLGIFTPLTVTFLIIAAVLGIFIGFKVKS